MSEPTKCGFCEEPVPEGRTDGFCDDQCKDLAARSLKTKPKGKTGLWAGPRAGRKDPK